MISRIKRSHREKLLNQKGLVIWFSGLSGAGKTTIARALEKSLYALGCNTYILDGDVLRNGLNKDLGLSPEDRNENIRRVSEVAALFADAGLICICALISPYEVARKKAREISGGSFLEVFVKCPIEECQRRDPKGLYAKFKSGEISGMTGIDAPYEIPTSSDIVVDTGIESVDDCIKKILEKILEKI